MQFSLFLLQLLYCSFYLGIINPSFMDEQSSNLHGFIINYFGWLYHLAGFIFLVFCFFLLLAATVRSSWVKMMKYHNMILSVVSVCYLQPAWESAWCFGELPSH